MTNAAMRIAMHVLEERATGSFAKRQSRSPDSKHQYEFAYKKAAVNGSEKYG
jgi:hypothetical protein